MRIFADKIAPFAIEIVESLAQSHDRLISIDEKD